MRRCSSSAWQAGDQSRSSTPKAAHRTGLDTSAICGPVIWRGPGRSSAARRAIHRYGGQHTGECATGPPRTWRWSMVASSRSHPSRGVSDRGSGGGASTARDCEAGRGMSRSGRVRVRAACSSWPRSGHGSSRGARVAFNFQGDLPDLRWCRAARQPRWLQEQKEKEQKS
jgi:hypothetical protein